MLGHSWLTLLILLLEALLMLMLCVMLLFRLLVRFVFPSLLLPERLWVVGPGIQWLPAHEFKWQVRQLVSLLSQQMFKWMQSRFIQ